jgi:hypothetical protein
MKRGAEKQLTKDDDASDEETDVSCNISLSEPRSRVHWLGNIPNVQESRRQFAGDKKVNIS